MLINAGDANSSLVLYSVYTRDCDAGTMSIELKKKKFFIDKWVIDDLFIYLFLYRFDLFSETAPVHYM